MSKKIRIHLADDHHVLIDGLKTLIETNPNYEISGFSLNGVNLIDKCINEDASVLILDINMPEKDGIEVLKEFASKNIDLKIIVLSSYDDIKLIKEVMKLGAKGYLTKQSAGDNILEAISKVYEGEEYFCENVRKLIFNTFAKKNPQINTSKVNCYEKNISGREIEILKLIALEYSSKEISNELFISINTVETHRKNILRKLNIKSTIGLVKFAIQNELIKI